jgi:phage baseplate assembly protein V
MTTAERTYRRVQTAIGTGRITATDDSKAAHSAQIAVGPGETIDNVPVIQIYGLASHARPGSDATLLFVGGDRGKPVAVATNDQRARLRNLKPGEVALYTDQGDTITIQRGGTIVIHCATKVRIEAPRLECTGDIVAQCDGTAISLLTHKHRDVQSGGGTSGVPVP